MIIRRPNSSILQNSCTIIIIIFFFSDIIFKFCNKHLGKNYWSHFFRSRHCFHHFYRVTVLDLLDQSSNNHARGLRNGPKYWPVFSETGQNGQNGPVWSRIHPGVEQGASHSVLLAGTVFSDSFGRNGTESTILLWSRRQLPRYILI
jgi:hypothetical protein